MELLGVLAAVSAIVGLIYLILIGQKSIPELLEARRRQRSQQQIGEDPSKDLTVALPKSNSVVLNNLPPRPKLIGRQAELQKLEEGLISSYNLIMIDGIGGIGKSALALEFAHQIIDIANRKDHQRDTRLDFDAIIWVSAETVRLDADDLADTIARVLDYPQILALPTKNKIFKAQQLLRLNRTLLIIDGLEKVTRDDAITFIDQLPNPSKCIITSRIQKIGNVYSISLTGLNNSEALELATREAHVLGLSLNQGRGSFQLQGLLELTGGAPLAIKWSIGQIRQRGQSIEAVIRSLKAAHGDLFQRCFSELWDILTPDARTILMEMTFLAKLTSRDAIREMSRMTSKNFNEPFGQLVEMRLVEASTDIDENRRVYHLHPLTRSFAVSKMKEDRELSEILEDRFIRYFLAYSKKHGDQEWQHYDHSGYDILEAELLNIHAAINQAISLRRWEYVVDFYRHLMHFWGQRGYWKERIGFGEEAVKAAVETGDFETQAWVFVDGTAWILIERGEAQQAEEDINRGLDIIKSHNFKDSAVCQAIAYWHLGRIKRTRGELAEAQVLLTMSMKKHPPQRIVARIHRELAHIAQESGDLQSALRELQEALHISESIGDQTGRVVASVDLGSLYLMSSDAEQAGRYFEQAQELAYAFHRRSDMARARLGLLRLAVASGNMDRAKVLATQAYDAFERLGMVTEMNELQQYVDLRPTKPIRGVGP